jgi:hypothetical protein
MFTSAGDRAGRQRPPIERYQAGTVVIENPARQTRVTIDRLGNTNGQNFIGAVIALTDGATVAIDASLGDTFILVALGDRTISVPTNATSGQKIVIRHNASGANRTLTLSTAAGGFRFGTDITALTATTSGKTDYIGAIYNSTSSTWDVVAYARGF